MTWLPGLELWGDKAIRVAILLVGAVIVSSVAQVVVGRIFEHSFNNSVSKKFYMDERRVKTLALLARSVTRYAVYFLAVVLILNEFNVNTTSLIAGAGILGLALGMGAQSLIRDLITGFFIIFEDQYAVGDYITSGDMAGFVEEIGFRTTKLRAFTGVLHIIPHGQIMRITNHTRGEAQASVLIPLSYQTDVDQALKLLGEVCRTLEGAIPEMVSPPQLLGIVEFGPLTMKARIIAKTLPLQQSAVEAAIRRRVKSMFDQAGVVMPSAACRLRE